jgi:hypothetical protein
MFDAIKRDLAENFRGDDKVLLDLIDEVESIALSISNNRIEVLKPYIKKCVIAEYLARGGEGLKSLSEGGKSSSFEDNINTMRDNIIKNHLRVMK